MEYYIGVDVGTGSVRAALVNTKGHILKTSVKEITTWNPEPNFYEQSSDEIWAACINVIKDVITNIDKACIKGLGFAATCSLVILDKDYKSLTVSKSGDHKRNIILWMDHRAHKEADLINATHHKVLDQVGGKISLEMEIPKLLWLKNNLKDTWFKSGLYMDLADFLTFKATGCDTRSLCTLVCKWCYQSSPNKDACGWPKDFFARINLSDIYDKIGEDIKAPKTFCGLLTSNTLIDLGLNTNQEVAVSSGLIDAHSGALGLLSTKHVKIEEHCQHKLSLICGTSTCHMIVQDDYTFVSGIWGPYHNAIFEDMYLSEAGQSATGKLIDFVVCNHKAYGKVLDAVQSHDKVYDYLNTCLHKMAVELKIDNVCLLTKDLHVWPDFHGNRSPLADATLKGMVYGLTLSASINDLALLYLATLQSLCYGTRHIIEKLEQSGIGPVKVLLICGGLANNPLFVQTQADVCGLPMLIPDEKESVLLGGAICGASAYRQYTKREAKDMFEGMGSNGRLVEPVFGEVAKFHLKKYKVFMEMVKDQYKYRNMMDLIEL